MAEKKRRYTHNDESDDDMPTAKRAKIQHVLMHNTPCTHAAKLRYRGCKELKNQKLNLMSRSMEI